MLAIEPGATTVWGPGPRDIALDAPSRIENAGELLVTNDRSLRGSGTLANAGALRKLSHGTTTLALLLDNDGTLEVAAGILDVQGSGLANRGTVRVAASVDGAGVLRTTTFVQAAGARLEVGIAGTTPFARAGAVQVTAAAPELAGARAVTKDGSYAPVAPQTMVIVASTAAPVRAFDTTAGLEDAHARLVSDATGIARQVEPPG